MGQSDISTLVRDIEKLFEGADLSERIEHFASKLGKEVSLRFKEYGDDRKQTLRMSNVGHPLRQLWYAVHGMPGEVLPVDAKVKFLYGSIIEELFIHLMIEAGHKVECLQQEVEVDGVKGHIDVICDGVLVDVKSASTFSYKKFKAGEIYNDDPFGYVAQLTGYKQALGVKRAGWLVIDKTLGHFCFVELKSKEDYDVSKRIKTVRSALSSDVEPPRCYEDKSDGKSGNRVLAIGCSYCSHKAHCWRDANNGLGLLERVYSTGPRWFTSLVKEPRLKETFETFPTKQQEDQVN